MTDPFPAECDICGASFLQYNDETLCDICAICEQARLDAGEDSTPRYHKDKAIGRIIQ